MKKFRYKKVNAFTSEGSAGNPAAYLMMEEGELSGTEMQKIAKEHAGFVSEMVFCSPSRVADLKLTYYSSECEVDFCGHGTIAAMYDLIRCDEKLKAQTEILIETNKKGLLRVENALKSEDAVYITAPEAQQLELKLAAKQIAAALKLEATDLAQKYAVDFIDAGLRTLIVPIEKYELAISIYLELKQLEHFCIANGIDIILIFCMNASSAGYLAHTRVFAPKFGYLEDPATGSGNSAFANYLIKHELWDGSQIALEQGGDRMAFNTIKVKQKDGHILFGGKADVIIDGFYYLNESSWESHCDGDRA